MDRLVPTNLMICRDFNYLCVYAVLLFSVVSVRICYQRNRLTSKVGLFEYQVLNGKLIVPTGCENSSVRYCSVSTPFGLYFTIFDTREEDAEYFTLTIW